MDSPWSLASVAQAQRDLVEYQLNEVLAGRSVPVFDEYCKALTELMEHRRKKGENGPLVMMDAGCGCGHYGVLTLRTFSGVQWYGLDSSPAMIDEAAKMLERYNVVGNVGVLPVEECRPDLYECVLLSQVLEITDNPPEVLERILSQAKHYVILHRLRTNDGTTGTSGRILEPTYLGLPSRNWVWDSVPLLVLLRKYGHLIYSVYHSKMRVIVWEKE